VAKFSDFFCHQNTSHRDPFPVEKPTARKKHRITPKNIFVDFGASVSTVAKILILPQSVSKKLLLLEKI